MEGKHGLTDDRWRHGGRAGRSDGVTVTVTGPGADGRRGPAVSARARRTIRKPKPKPKRHKKH